MMMWATKLGGALGRVYSDVFVAAVDVTVGQIPACVSEVWPVNGSFSQNPET